MLENYQKPALMFVTAAIFVLQLCILLQKCLLYTHIAQLSTLSILHRYRYALIPVKNLYLIFYILYFYFHQQNLNNSKSYSVTNIPWILCSKTEMNMFA